MKKKLYFIISILFFLIANNCSGYKPIYGSSNLNFQIIDYALSGNETLSNKIYSQLKNISTSNKKNDQTKNIYLFVASSKSKNPTSKNSSGKILGYKVSLDTKFIVKDFDTNQEILNETFSISASYDVQDQISETKNLENKSIDNLLNKTYDDLLIKLSETLLQNDY